MTPFDADGEIAPRRLAPIIDRALQAGVHIPVVNGNTGDCHALTTDEACAMVVSTATLATALPAQEILAAAGLSGMALFDALVVMTQGSAVAPFIYTIF
jgi:dihydrodipicolinate synthase/N-acetylneuraminate lyase